MIVQVLFKNKMAKIKRSEYIIVSRSICRNLFKANCWGKGSMYLDNLAKGLSDRKFSRLNISKDKVEVVLEALVKQKSVSRKRKNMVGSTI